MHADYDSPLPAPSVIYFLIENTTQEPLVDRIKTMLVIPMAFVFPHQALYFGYCTF